MLLYDKPYLGIKSFNISTMDRRPLTTLIKALKKSGAEDLFVIYDGSEVAEESVLSVQLCYAALKKVLIFERTGLYNFEMSERGQKPKSFRETG